MIDQLISDIITNTISNFDIPYCITVNVATYLFIKAIQDAKVKGKVSTWNKRIIFLFISIVIGAMYCAEGSDYKIIFNSAIIAPVSWSWIFKPICAKLKIDYHSKLNNNQN